MATTNLGRVAIVPKGTWNASTTYKKLDLVTFEGSSYIALQNNSNKPVSNTTYWQKIAQKGDQGIQGIQGIQGETGNGIASIELTNTSGAVKTYTITYTNGNTTTFQVTDGEVTNEVLAEELEAYALNDGYYEEMTVGAAENLTGRGDGVPAVFTRRTAGGEADIADGIATIKSIKGNTLIWNQRFRYSSTFPQQPNTSGLEGWASTFVLDTTNHTVAVTNTRDNYSGMGISYLFKENEMLTEHKYYLAVTLSDYSVTDEHTPNFRATVTKGWNTVSGFANDVIIGEAVQNKKYRTIFTLPDMSSISDEYTFRVTMYVAYRSDSGYKVMSGDTFTLKNIMFIDLTKMFGAGNEPSTPEEFEQLFPLGYYDFNIGSFLNFTGDTLKTVGFNQWDEEWEQGQIGYNPEAADWGQNRATSSGIRSKNYIPIFNQQYYCTINNSYAIFAILYDEDKNPILNPSNGYGYFDIKNKVLMPPANARYMRFYTVDAYGTIYRNDICINIAWSGYRNGEYEKYWSNVKQLPISQYFPGGLMGFKVLGASTRYQDELTATRAIKRVWQKTLNGTENWYAYTGAEATYHTYAILVSNLGFPTNALRNGILNDPIYKVMSGGNRLGTIPKGYYAFVSGLLYITDNDYETLADWKAHLASLYDAGNPLQITVALCNTSGTTDYVVETDLEESLNLTYKVSDFGTEEILPANTSVPATSPFNGTVLYGLNAVDTLRRLPENYISKDSMEAFLSVLNNVTNGTWSMTFNSETGKYVFSYVADAEEQQGGE